MPRGGSRSTRGAWIETGHAMFLSESRPSRGAWIETTIGAFPLAIRSVAPLAGAWIETVRRRQRVAPLAGAWIETGRNAIDYRRVD
jgi:hypothetical protein